MPDSAIVAALLAGLAGSAHCIAMCGAFVAAGAPAVVPLVPARRLALERAVTQGGRLAMYAALGALLGSVGGAAFALDWPSWQRTLYAVANGAMLLVAAGMLGTARSGRGLEAAGLAVFRRIAPAAAPLLRAPTLGARFAMGMMWGLTPCALIYAVLPLALFAGGSLQGAGVMAALWLGTLPALTLARGLLARAFARVPPRWGRTAAATLVAAFACVGLLRAWLDPNALAAGPFCLVR